MNEDLQQQFVSWLADKLGAKDEQDLKAKVQQLGQDGIKQAYDSFMQEQQQQSTDGGQQVPMQADGGKLDYLLCLKAYKKGGKAAMVDCGCGTKMKSGGRMEKNENSTTKDYMGQRKDGKKPNGQKGDRKESSKTERNPGSKDSMTKGSKIDWVSARTNVPKGNKKASIMGGIC